MTDLYYLIPIGVLAGTNIAACVGWSIAHLKRVETFKRLVNVQRQRDNYRQRAFVAEKEFAEARRLLFIAASKRSTNVAKGNHTRALKAKALRDATTAQLAGEVQAKARELRVAA